MASEPPRPALGRSGAARKPERREKMFGLGRPRALDRNAKVRIMHWARCLTVPPFHWLTTLRAGTVSRANKMRFLSFSLSPGHKVLVASQMTSAGGSTPSLRQR